MASDRAGESFRGLLLRHRGRTSLTQRDLAAHAGVSMRSVQDWEAGVKYPGAQHLQALVAALLEGGGLADGREAAEAEALWAAALREAPRLRTPFDQTWFVGLLAKGPRSAGHQPTTDQASTVGRAQTSVASERRQDWGEAPELVGFLGRTQELTTLKRWVLEDRCRLIAFLGIGGIGKTTLAAALAQDVAPSFERVYWRSVRNAPSVSEWLGGAINFVSDHQLVAPEGEAPRLQLLLQLLRELRCLLALDNFETLLEPGARQGRYREGCAGYGTLLQSVGEGRHQSCLMITSREAPPDLGLLGPGLGVRAIELGGLGVPDGQALLADKQLSGDDVGWAELVARYGGNGLALKMAGETIRQVFGGDIAAFLGFTVATSGTVFGGIRRLLEAQVEQRLSTLEQELLRWLAIEREPVAVGALIAHLGPRVGRGAAIEAVEALRRHSLVERTEPGNGFTLQSVVLEYVTDRLVDGVVEEISRGQPSLLVEQPLIQAQANDYVRQSQERLIGAPILELLKARYTPTGTEQRLLHLLAEWRDRDGSPREQGYGPGNVVNLLRLLLGDLRGLDLAQLVLRQAYLAVPAQETSLVQAQLSDSVIAEPMSAIVCTRLSPDGEYVVAGTFDGAARMWQVADRKLILAVDHRSGPVWAVALDMETHLVFTAAGDGNVFLWNTTSGERVRTLSGHKGAVRGLALSADGKRLVSSGSDGTVRVWDPANAECLRVLSGHRGEVWGVALSADGQRVASCGADATVRVWDATSGECLQVLTNHTAAVLCVALSADGQRVASGGAEANVRVWDGDSGECLHVLSGHTAGTRGVALSADGQRLASSALDGMARVWDTANGECLRVLMGHIGEIRGVALSPDGRRAATGGLDGTVRVWDVVGGQCLQVLAGQTLAVWAVALSTANGRLVGSVTLDGCVRLWDAASGQCLRVLLTGHRGEVRDVSLSADGRRLASAGNDATIRIWDAATGDCQRVLNAHTAVLTMALSSNGQRLASGGADATVLVWDAATGECLQVLEGHAAAVRVVALSEDGCLVASSQHDSRVRLWDTATGDCLRVLTADTALLCMALSANARRVVGGGADATVRVWDAASGECLHVLRGHTSEVRAVSLSANGLRLVSGGLDGTVRVWDTANGECLHVLAGHSAAVWDVALTDDARLVISGGLDGAVRLWDGQAGTWLRTLRPDRLYERMDITRLAGATPAQRAALLALGAFEQPDPVGESAATLPLLSRR